MFPTATPIWKDVICSQLARYVLEVVGALNHGGSEISLYCCSFF